MRIVMMTNTYKPILGGLERSIETFSRVYRELGHEVKIVAPTFEGMPKYEEDVIRLPALQKFQKTDFSVNLPVPGFLKDLFKKYRPEIVHAHHPFLIGDLALRLSGQYRLPLFFTYHTMYEQYTDYFSLENELVQKFVIQLAVAYSNLTDMTLTPSESVLKTLEKRGVHVPMRVVPTGVDVECFKDGDGRKLRESLGLTDSDFLLGYAGRISDEKNLLFLCDAVGSFLAMCPQAHFAIIGKGKDENTLRQYFQEAELSRQVHFCGVREGQDLIDAYHALDVFTFASVSETQGLVVTEAMAAGVPVVAIDSPGIREVVQEKKNGRLISGLNRAAFVHAIRSLHKMDPELKSKMCDAAIKTAENLSVRACAEKGLAAYESILHDYQRHQRDEEDVWDRMLNRLTTEWDMFLNLSKATTHALVDSTVKDNFIYEFVQQKKKGADGSKRSKS